MTPYSRCHSAPRAAPTLLIRKERITDIDLEWVEPGPCKSKEKAEQLWIQLPGTPGEK